MFVSFKKETLDLHSLFEAGGNDPDARTAVLDKVDRLVKDGLLEERGNDFYALTASRPRQSQTRPQGLARLLVLALFTIDPLAFDQELAATRLNSRVLTIASPRKGKCMTKILDLLIGSCQPKEKSFDPMYFS